MEFPLWIMLSGAILIFVGFVGLAILQETDPSY